MTLFISTCNIDQARSKAREVWKEIICKSPCLQVQIYNIINLLKPKRAEGGSQREDQKCTKVAGGFDGASVRRQVHGMNVDTNRQMRCDQKHLHLHHHVYVMGRDPMYCCDAEIVLWQSTLLWKDWRRSHSSGDVTRQATWPTHPHHPPTTPWTVGKTVTRRSGRGSGTQRKCDSPRVRSRDAARDFLWGVKRVVW